MKTQNLRLVRNSLFAALSSAGLLAGNRASAQTTYNQSTTNLFASGTNLVEFNASTNLVTTFRPAVSNAWATNGGGVCDFPTAVTTGTTVFRGNYGTNAAKRMQVNSSVGMQNSNTGGGSFYPISGGNLTTTSANQSDFNWTLALSDTNGLVLPSEIITQVGFVILARTAAAYPLDVTATAAFSDGTTQAETATIGNARGASDTFYGFTAPGGLSITNIRFQSFIPTTTTPSADRIGIDDFGFITGPSFVTPLPQITGVTPAAYAISAASNGIQFNALTYVTVPTNNITLVVNSNDVSSQLVFSGSSTNYLVSYNGLSPDQTYTFTIGVSNSGGAASLTQTIYTTTTSFVLYDSGGFTDDTLYPLGALTNLTNGSVTWTPDPSEPAQIINVGDPQDKVLERQNTGATRSDVLAFAPVSTGRVIIDFDAFVSTTLGRTLDISLLPTTGGNMGSFISWGQVSGDLAYFDNTNWDAISVLPSDWHHVQIINYLSGFAAGKYDVLVNGTAVAQKIAWRNAAVGSAFSRIRVETANTGPVFEFGNIDNLVVTAAVEDTNAFLPPQVVNLSPGNHAVIKPSDGFSFAVTSGQAITSTNVTAILDGVDISTSLIAGGSPTNLTLAYNSLTTGSHTVAITAVNSAGTNSVTNNFIATLSAFTLYDSGGFTDDTLYPVGTLQAVGTTGSVWVPDVNNPGQIVDDGAPQGKALERTQVGVDAIDYLQFPSVSTGIVTVDADVLVSELDSRSLDMCLMQDTGNNMASFLGWGIVSNQFAYFNGPSATWIGESSPGTNWHHYTTINYMSGSTTRTFDLLVDGVVVGLKLPFRQNIAVGTPVGKLRVGAIRGTAPGSFGDVDNLVITAKPITVLPNSVTISNLVSTGAAFQFSFATQSGYNHSIQYRNAITGSPWTVLQAFPGTGSVTNFADTNLSSTTRFYRVQTTQ